MMKGSIFVVLFVVIAGFAFAQTEDQNPEKQPSIKEVPAAAAHGKAISELAKSTPGGPEKGKIISSAARQKGMENSHGKNPNGNSQGEIKNNRPEHSKGNGAQKSGKTGIPTRAVPPSKPKPSGYHGGS